jgi:hypothetical protein
MRMVNSIFSARALVGGLFIAVLLCGFAVVQIEKAHASSFDINLVDSVNHNELCQWNSSTGDYSFQVAVGQVYTGTGTAITVNGIARITANGAQKLSGSANLSTGAGTCTLVVGGNAYRLTQI